MGSGSLKGQAPTQEEMSTYFAVKKAYEDLSPLQKQSETELLALADLYRKEARKGSDIVAELLSLSVDQKEELGKTVLQAALQREDGLRAAERSTGDYEKSFSGTKQDTQAENEYASLIRGDEGTESTDNTAPLLRPVECNNQEEIAKLRSAGKWLRYVGAKGCYMWIHSLTREVTALRPPDYIDEEVPCEAQEEEDIAGGYPTCSLLELPDMIEKTVDGDKKTPLLIDNSEDNKVSSFLSYKAILVDVSILAVGYQKSGQKVSDLMETVRTKAVAAMKSGTMLALRLGHLSSEQANFKRKLCARNGFPAEMFQEGGKKMFTPIRKPRFEAMFRQEDLEQNQCLVKADGFRFCVITSIPPKDIVTKLGDSLPLGYMEPIHILSS